MYSVGKTLFDTFSVTVPNRPLNSHFWDSPEGIVPSRDRVRHGVLPETAAVFTLRDVEPLVLLRLLPFKGGPDGGGGQLRTPETRTVSFDY